MDSGATAGQGAAKRERKIKRDHMLGLLIVGAAFALGVLISRDSHERSEPEFSQEPAPPTTEGLVGFPNSVDVLQGLEMARALTPREHLVRIHALGVRANGHVDLTQAGARVRYLFQSEKGQGPQSQRPPGTLARRHYCGQQAVDISSVGIGAQRDRPATDCEPEFRSVPTPTCGPEQLWQVAKQKGAGERQRAKVEYIPGPNGPVWNFRIEGTDVDFTTGPDCTTLVE